MALTKVTIETTGRGSARSVSEKLSHHTPEPLAVTEFENVESRGWRVEAYFEDAPDLAGLASALGLGGSDVSISSEPVPDENWVTLSQAALPPVIAGRFVIHGSHDRGRVGWRATAIEIDAGEAFGTAHHATTLGCLLALDTLAHRSAPRRVLDLGCGSGVLAIAASRVLPRARVLASDIDPTAVEVARSNIRLNRAQGRVRALCAVGLHHTELRREAPFDLVLANILAGPLIHLAPSVAQAIAPGGIAVLSGILSEQAMEVQAAWRAAGFSMQGKLLLNGWATLVMRRQQNSASRRRLV